MPLPITLIRPLDGRNAFNTPVLIVLDPSAPFPAAVWAQEVWEARHKLGAFVRPLRLFAMLFRRRRFGQQLELMGHEVEVQSAAWLYGSTIKDHRRSEAETMVRHYPQFSGWEPERVEAEMAGRSAEALAWVVRDAPKLEAMKDRLG